MKQRAVLLTHAVRIQEKRLQEEKLLASEQARLDETFNKVQEILALSQETEANCFQSMATGPVFWKCWTRRLTRTS